ncbi:MAG: hypothetical protein IPH07_31975 [Deltaproteobacteria bacterium]|nr:hypothetical protein [Deltaproteobacteria bacterium]
MAGKPSSSPAVHSWVGVTLGKPIIGLTHETEKASRPVTISGYMSPSMSTAVAMLPT